MTDPAQSISPTSSASPTIDAYAPPTDDAIQQSQSAEPKGTLISNDADLIGETLEEQNIFEMLGVTDGSEEEREAFLDELQQVIWEDFLETDVPLLITQEEVTQLTAIKSQNYASEAEGQEALLIFLEKLIPDLEEIMLEKALELKEDMFRERLTGMKEFFTSDPNALKTIAEAEALLASEQWHSAARLLNSLKK